MLELARAQVKVYMTKEELGKFLLSIPYEDNTIFSVTFIKRMTGELRTMVCRRRVKRHLHGGDAPYSFKTEGLLPVFDLQKMDYRTIPSEGVIQINYRGCCYKLRKGKKCTAKK